VLDNTTNTLIKILIVYEKGTQRCFVNSSINQSRKIIQKTCFEIEFNHDF